MLLPSPAKINLFLHVTGRRPDGYHLLQTLFQFLDYGDSLNLETDTSGQIRRIDQHPFSLPDNDLCVQAATRLRHLAGHPDLGCRLTLTKQIAPGTGLGGGSSNAATTLLGLNRLWELNLPLPPLLKLAASLGADVPIFVHGASAWAEGVGDRFTAHQPDECWYTVVTPRAGASTAAVFQSIDPSRNHAPVTPDQYRYECTENDLEAATVALVPEVGEALTALKKSGGNPRMSGSGSAVFVRWPTEQAAGTSLETALGKLNIASDSLARFTGFIARGTNRSPLTMALQRT